MKPKPYQVIFTLLILSVAFVLVLQAFWIRNFYNQKQDEFNKTIYSALEQVSNKLKEREGLRVIQEKISAGSAHPENKMLSGKPSVPNNVYVAVNRSQLKVGQFNAGNLNALKKNMREIQLTDSSVSIVNGSGKILHKNEITRLTKKVKDVDKLLDKMILEISVEDHEVINSDTLKNIIRRIFENKGLFLPFEFALKKIFKNVSETLAASPGFREKENAFSSDLSADNVFSNHHFLFIQFPDQNTYVFASIKNMLLLSLFFSLLIIAVFFYTMRLILNQKKLSEIKNDFVNNMTHELKTPIATNSLAIDAIANPLIKNDEAKFRDYIRILKEENQKLNVHVERVLQMALLDKGDLPLNKSAVDLVAVIKAAIDNYKLQIAEKKAIVNFVSGEEQAIISGDEQHLQTVFGNLLDNALKYSAAHCVIDINLVKRGKEIVVHFKDNGIGIDKSQREKVFEKFYRAQGGNLHDVKGFGLGLSYVKSILEAHGGKVELKSEGGQGSEFIIMIEIT